MPQPQTLRERIDLRKPYRRGLRYAFIIVGLPAAAHLGACARMGFWDEERPTLLFVLTTALLAATMSLFGMWWVLSGRDLRQAERPRSE